MGASASRPDSREPSPNGLGPSGFDPSRKEPYVCGQCGDSPVHIIVGGVPLCDRHWTEWLNDEASAATEDQIKRVMAALDAVSDERIDGEWDDHLRRMALAAIGAM